MSSRIIVRSRTSAPARRAASTSRASSTVRRGQYITAVPSIASGVPCRLVAPKWIRTVSMGGQPVAASASSRPHLARKAVVRGQMK